MGSLLLVAGWFSACSSDTGDDSPGAAGKTNVGSGGQAAGGSKALGTAGTGVIVGTAGSGTAGSGTGGSGGGAAGTGFACAGTKPAAPLVTSFADLLANPTSAGNFTFALGTPGGTFSYQAGALTLTDVATSLNVKGNVKAYDGFGVYFTACTDASAYTGVSFNIKGNPGPKGTLNFRFQTNATTALDAVNMKGSCSVPAGTVDTYPLCHPASFDVPVTAGGAVVNVKFSDVLAGVPVATVNGKDLVGLEWAFSWTGAADTAYDVDVTVDDITFTGPGSGGSGGSGGAGGSGGSGGAGGSGGTAQ